jgi:hypothetical protein
LLQFTARPAALKRLVGAGTSASTRVFDALLPAQDGDGDFG